MFIFFSLQLWECQTDGSLRLIQLILIRILQLFGFKYLLFDSFDITCQSLNILAFVTKTSAELPHFHSTRLQTV